MSVVTKWSNHTPVINLCMQLYGRLDSADRSLIESCWLKSGCISIEGFKLRKVEQHCGGLHGATLSLCQDGTNLCGTSWCCFILVSKWSKLVWHFMKLLYPCLKMKKTCVGLYVLLYPCLKMGKTCLALHALRKDCVILQLYWWLFSSTKHCGGNMV